MPYAYALRALTRLLYAPYYEALIFSLYSELMLCYYFMPLLRRRHAFSFTIDTL